MVFSSNQFGDEFGDVAGLVFVIMIETIKNKIIDARVSLFMPTSTSIKRSNASLQ